MLKPRRQGCLRSERNPNGIRLSVRLGDDDAKRSESDCDEWPSPNRLKRTGADSHTDRGRNVKKVYRLRSTAIEKFSRARGA